MSLYQGTWHIWVQNWPNSRVPVRLCVTIDSSPTVINYPCRCLFVQYRSGMTFQKFVWQIRRLLWKGERMKISKTANKRTAASRSVSMAINLIEKHSRLKVATLKVTIVAGAAARVLGHRFGVSENDNRDLPDCDVCSSLPSRRWWRRKKRLEKNFALLPVVASLSGRQLAVSVAKSFEDTLGTISYPVPSTADIPRSTHEQSPRRWVK